MEKVSFVEDPNDIPAALEGDGFSRASIGQHRDFSKFVT